MNIHEDPLHLCLFPQKEIKFLEIEREISPVGISRHDDDDDDDDDDDVTFDVFLIRLNLYRSRILLAF